MKQFFQDRDGDYSMMRLVVFMLTLTGIIGAFTGMSPTMVGLVLGFAVGGKGFQKISEKK